MKSEISQVRNFAWYRSRLWQNSAFFRTRSGDTFYFQLLQESAGSL